MAGIYIHVPFCAKRCAYCDFYTQTNHNLINEYVDAVCKEIELRKDYLHNESIKTIYFGGGTPSQLSPEQIEKIMAQLGRFYDLSACEEFTLEANPDDLTDEFLSRLLALVPINRISMGVQSFDDDDLRFLNRRHSAAQAKEAVALCRKHGITNISIDLIYGLPDQTLEKWERNIQEAIALETPHLSAYHLIYEEGTPLYKLWEKGKVKQADDELSVEMFKMLIDELEKAGIEQYEISNFAKDGAYSKHNTSYWQATPYLGLGPSAHSFDGTNREWNVASIKQYVESIHANTVNREIEELDTRTRYNDYILTGLRTKWGIELDFIASNFGADYLSYCLEQAEPFLKEGLLMRDNNTVRLSREGIFISDGIMSDLMKLDDTES